MAERSKIQWNIRSQISEENQTESTDSGISSSEKQGDMAESSSVEWNVLDHSLEENHLNSVENGLPLSEEQDSETESSSDEGEYEISAGTDQPAESLEKKLKKANLSDGNDSETDSSSDEGQTVLFRFGRLESEKPPKKADLSDKNETASRSDEGQSVLFSFGTPEPEKSSEKSLKKADLSDENEYKVSTDELPSRIVDRDFIYMPPEMECFEERDEWKSSGKWLVFNHGDFKKLDSLWIGLQPLVASGILVGMKCSTATDRVNGVIMCYTGNCEDKKGVKMAADAIRNINNDGIIIYYKTNAATNSGFYRMYGDKFITKYMHTCACSLYERDEYNRWKKVVFEENVVV